MLSKAKLQIIHPSGRGKSCPHQTKELSVMPESEYETTAQKSANSKSFRKPVRLLFSKEQ